MRPVGPERGAPPPGRGPRVSPLPGRRAGGGGTRLPPGGGGIMRPPAGTTRGPLGDAPGGGVPGCAPVGRGAGGRDVTLAPGRDDTTRGAPLAGGAAGVGVTGVVGAMGAAGALDAAGATGAGATGAAAGATGAGVDSGAAVVVAPSVSAAFLGRAVLARAGAFFSFGSAPSSAAFFAFFGLSAAGSRFNPFSSAWRRTRSACASTMLDEGDDAPMPIELHKSTTSFEVMPNSLASVETRTFLPLKRWHLRQRRVLQCSPP